MSGGLYGGVARPATFADAVRMLRAEIELRREARRRGDDNRGCSAAEPEWEDECREQARKS